MRTSIIVAAARNGIIGRDGDLPWKLSRDLQRFKSLTMGHHIIMGRKTCESIGRLLPGRTTVVVTRQTDYVLDGGLVAHGLDEAIQLAAGDEEVFIIGGAQLYEAALPAADRLYLTTVAADVDGDTSFPTWNEDNWEVVTDERFDADERNDYPTRFRLLDRKPMA